MAGRPVPLAPGEIERLMAEDGRHVPHTSSVPARRAFAAGETVRVLGGAFRDFEGVIEVIDELGAHLSIELLGRRLTLPVPLTGVEHA
jgi:transcription antitermination factor NusG